MKAVGFGISMFLVCALVPAQTQTQPQPSEPSPALFAKPLPQWSQAEREWGFRNWDLRANARPVRKGNVVRMLPVGPPVAALAEEGEAIKQLAAFTKDYQLAGLLVLRGRKPLDIVLCGKVSHQSISGYSGEGWLHQKPR
jgi:hypothetical protein